MRQTPAFAVEGFFAKLTRRRLKRGVFRSVDDLKAAIDRFVVDTNADPKPFVWTAKPNRILATVKRGKQNVRVNPLAAPVRLFWLTPRQPQISTYVGLYPRVIAQWYGQ